MKIKKNDIVLIITGKDKGKTGTVEKVFVKEKRLIISGKNIYKKNAKISRKYPKGGIIDLPMPINISNVSLICQACNKKTKVIADRKDKKVQRICHKCQESLDKKIENK
ncbi:50S ribosomal protein L24 [Candidatus Berkelbacteria bacterium CG_4_8_14_3_um_filter_33_6]|uniref:Large ribosomal subunit protein uL24 n=1 Tax=Candidatus Berkelbacteria bacterium CG_4_10_14_0_2_um_filter_35_9_33_12 TaxID=1974499 RepID=A0A2M7W4K9_9BACT|nr:MAG: 50S ribosomal protein L24 [Candidatus Berkelbacteria bacterium CG23_combo_of_CG06-09_8_20_14_all_33_15]PIS08123.1 MAG: 50S ribosomal protein L24 [Candidatus Berkelbacteria bacterium CG10_big_fil_rev_8_21_14_0_10_33_10]PIX31285.1 MAG: 50S ribosomal protein L24 [Candidatus Berkelbacteria bacterium CG_4_8_14_3_um_filter_33_6]PJA20760.1 MAG: 50S ribosomal protein L24 [Candidatus Berkelbacteria bacterium CG_4_10_14_0_2_um_filter_35_9_33_12]